MTVLRYGDIMTLLRYCDIMTLLQYCDIMTLLRQCDIVTFLCQPDQVTAPTAGQDDKGGKGAEDDSIEEEGGEPVSKNIGHQ